MSTKLVLARSAPANGEAIKLLRVKAKKTQKELIRSSQVDLRTYQRAENGEAISPATLREIAGLLNTTFEVSVKNNDQTDGGQVRLYNCGGRGALQILKLLQKAPGSVRYSYDLDPVPEEAERIAVVVDFCNAHTNKSFSEEDPAYLGDASAAYIRAVGQLNEKLSELAKVGVNLFLGSYMYWTTLWERLPVEPHQEYMLPIQERRVLLEFSARSDDFILVDGPPDQESEIYQYDVAAEFNYNKRVHPDALEAACDWHELDRFKKFNRTCWEEQTEMDQARGERG